MLIKSVNFYFKFKFDLLFYLICHPKLEYFYVIPISLIIKKMCTKINYAIIYMSKLQGLILYKGYLCLSYL